MKLNDGKNSSHSKDKTHLISLFFVFCSISYKVFKTILNQLDTEENGIDTFTSAYKHYGIHVDHHTNEIKVKEWAPGARAMYIRGDFSWH